MTTLPNSPRLLKGGIVLLDPDSGAMQCHSDTFSRTVQMGVLEGGAT